MVTGAGSGIGLATANLFHRQGATVIATDMNDIVTDSGISADDESFIRLRHDVTSAEDWDRVFDRVKRYDRLDILVNNAGIMLVGEFEKATLDDLQLQYRIHVEGPFFGMQRAIPLMRHSVATHGARPSIVNVSSIYGQLAGTRSAPYSASKGAVKMLSKAVAVEVAPFGIRVNSVHPGPTATNLSANHKPPCDANGVVIPLEDRLEALRKAIPMGRFGSVGDIAPVIAFLASDAAAFVTGAEIIVDGGYSAI